MNYLQRGSRGPEVSGLQNSLNQRGSTLIPDGIFGGNTDRAVRNFQSLARLSADGIVGPNTWTALGRISAGPSAPTPAPVPPATPSRRGQNVTLSHAAKYKDKVLGPAPYKGECAAGVQVVFSAAGKSLGRTSTWKPGLLVKGNNVAPGTAIASFKNGRYWKHAAILIRETSNGLEVWDQWAGQPWHTRTLKFTSNAHDGSNNGNLFYVVSK